jgi:hypothetical protein
MPLIACPDCKREISDQAPARPQCGRPQQAAPRVAPESIPSPFRTASAAIGARYKATNGEGDATTSQGGADFTASLLGDQPLLQRLARLVWISISDNPPLFIFGGIGVLLGVTMIVLLLNSPNSTPAATALSGMAKRGGSTGLDGRSPPSDIVELGSVNEGPVTANRAEVESLVATMIARRAIISISPDRDEAQVNPLFWEAADLNGKRGLVILIAEYCKIRDPSTGGAVTIRSSSGRKLAEFSAMSGVNIAGDD